MKDGGERPSNRRRRIAFWVFAAACGCGGGSSNPTIPRDSGSAVDATTEAETPNDTGAGATTDSESVGTDAAVEDAATRRKDGGGADAGGETDAGALDATTTEDAGESTGKDAGTPKNDAGKPSDDSGSPTSDAGPSCDAAPPLVSKDCILGACPQISVTGDAPDTMTSFYGNLDPCIRRDPNGTHALYLTYSFPYVIRGTATPIIEIHLATSTDGNSWRFVTKLWPTKQQPDNNYVAHEVSNIAADGTGGTTTWYGIAHYYEVVPGGGLYTQPNFNNSSYYVLASAPDPANLGATPADVMYWTFGTPGDGGGSGTAIATPDETATLNLTTLRGDPSCAGWKEPALLVQNQTLYLAAQCSGSGGAYKDIEIFAAPIEPTKKMAKWTWTYLGPLFKPRDPTDVMPDSGPVVFSAIDLTQKANGGVIAIFTPVNSAAQYGGRTADVVSLGTVSPPTAPALVRDCQGKLVVTGEFPASDLYDGGNPGTGASAYEAQTTNPGILLVRRYVTEPQGYPFNGFTFDTGQHPE